MSTLHPDFAASAELASARSRSKTRRSYGSLARLRLRIHSPEQHSSEAIVARLSDEYGLAVKLTAAVQRSAQVQSCFDLELSGSITQLQKGLAYLQALEFVIKGKPNADGDSWYH